MSGWRKGAKAGIQPARERIDPGKSRPNLEGADRPILVIQRRYRCDPERLSWAQRYGWYFDWSAPGDSVVPEVISYVCTVWDSDTRGEMVPIVFPFNDHTSSKPSPVHQQDGNELFFMSTFLQLFSLI